MNVITDEEKSILLKLARQTITSVVNGDPAPKINPEKYSQTLRDNGATFVTLTIDGNLRGCIGALEAYQPLVQDVCEHAAASALNDYRFSPVKPHEISSINIEISYLSAPKPLIYEQPGELPELLNPGIDGVILRDGGRRATFLPQVWEKIPSKVEFLNHLCWKMGVPTDTWRRKLLQVSIYHVEEFSEN